jgi:hypothetical protein
MPGSNYNRIMEAQVRLLAIDEPERTGRLP